MSRDTAALGFAFGRGCTADDAARFALYAQVHRDGSRRLDLSDLFEDWHNLTYVRRIERVLYGEQAA